MNITTHEEKKLTVKLDSMGFCIICEGEHDTIESVKEDILGQVVDDQEDTNGLVYFETPYALLSSVSAGYNLSFGENLISKLTDLQNTKIN